MKSNKIIILVLTIIIAISLTAVYLVINLNSNLIKLSYNEVIQKVNNKENFILCVSASECVHCQEYKPKLRKVANSYDIKIYYVNVDEFTDEEYETFKAKLSFDGGTPVTIFFKEGEEKTTATRINGNTKIETIINKLKSNGFINE